jgi:Phage gp6-like head-tail connector protein
MALVTLQQAKDHLKIKTTAEDADVAVKLAAAEAQVLSVCNTTSHWRTVTATWTDVTVPADVRQAILYQCAELYRFRGDDVEGPVRAGEDLSPLVMSLLRRSRDPVVA